jgi:hypothetical protein
MSGKPTCRHRAKRMPRGLKWGVKQKQGRNKLISKIDESGDLFTIPLSRGRCPEESLTRTTDLR